jgi:mannan endo-1,4-beta-mannosidase
LKNNPLHTIRKIVTIVLLVASIMFCKLSLAQQDVSRFKPSDKQADKGVVNLYRNLALLAPDYIMIGHQDALSYGISWKKDTDRSDIKDITGSHPAVFGWDIGGIELGQPVNLDSVPFNEMRENIVSVYLRGGINTISWHARNPVSGKSSWVEDKNSPNIIVAKILPGGSNHEDFKKQLDKVAAFLKSLKAPDGSLAPVIFRPWHENSGNWFWWGAIHCSSEEYKSLYRFTVDYLRNTHHLHNLLFAYSPDVGFKDADGYLERYPGDDLVDIIGLDDYNSLNTGHPEKLISNLEIIAKVAIDHNKIAALTETGCNRVERKDYFTDELLPCLDHSELTRSISWVLFWRNADQKQHFVPAPGHPAAENFKEFVKNKDILLLNNIPDMYKYYKEIKLSVKDI